jgi:small conductance mechanosensitive channel
VAGVGALGLAIGLALQGALSNFAGGILIVAFRPFIKGDFVEVAGNLGTVREIDILSTKIITPDNKTIIVPNGKLMADDVINFSETENMRLDMSFGVSYAANNEHVKSVLMEIVQADSRVLADPAPEVLMLEHGDSSVVYGVRPWCKCSDYWPLKFDITERVKVRLDEEGIEIPFPQRDIHIVSHVKNES